MTELNISKATTTDMTNIVSNYSVDSTNLDYITNEKESYWYFSDASTNFGYYKHIPELKKAIDALAIWTAGKGFETNIGTKVSLEHVTGWGEDSFQQIMQNMLVVKKVIGDSFAEIIRDNKKGLLLNLKPISPERVRIVVGPNGIILRYDIRKRDGSWLPMDKEKILHLCNDRVADEIHGTSVIDACRWVIDARNEALTDERKIKHRELAMGVLYVDSEDTAKIEDVKKKYADAISNGEVLVLPRETAELKDAGVRAQDRIAWIQYLENFFYQAVGIPRVIATSENYTEAASKVGFLTFEPIYTNEQTLLEQDLWNQLGVKVKFNRPPSLSGMMQESENKNTGQTGFQPNEVTATMGKVE